ncbi:hypothetical protein GCM10011487_33060 [Steroidobacter agaridevorans]|uniref:Uncharacterized protein n=1 Tax=Steroidobacter agaridevorans TaxID=2695856 RepID=A0A829YFE8_9GAMM|nr:hypothetical protein [Steroidobacter agaridevorans]GFE81306.1 hypothetical protein GCM10011487_33060 [Steroidobacter agaridevorans]
MTEPTDKVDEQPLDEYLKGGSSVSRQYRQLPGADVPPSLDRLVLRQAEEAVKRPSRPAWMRWTAPLAVAASAVLVVSIVLETGLRDETTVSAMQEKREAAEAPIETRMIEEPASEPSANAPAADSAAAELVMPVPPPPKIEVPPPASASEMPMTAVQRRAPPPPVAAPAPAPLEEQVAKAEERGNAAFVADVARQKSALEAAAREQELSASQRAMRGEQAGVAGPRDTVETPEPKAVLSYSRPISVTSADSMARLDKTYTDPEAWLKDIRQLRKDNKPEEADRQWKLFVAAFPNYEVAENDTAREANK